MQVQTLQMNLILNFLVQWWKRIIPDQQQKIALSFQPKDFILMVTIKQEEFSQ